MLPVQKKLVNSALQVIGSIAEYWENWSLNG